MAQWVDFVSAVLLGAGVRDTVENEDALLAVAAVENTQAANNILATTQPWPGATEFNSAHVKNYPTYDEGVLATIATLTNGLYDSVLLKMARNAPGEDILNAWVQSPWGTGRGVLTVLDEVRADAPAYTHRIVPGSTAPTVPPVAPAPITPCNDLHGNPPADYRILRVVTPFMSGTDVRTCQSLLIKAGFPPANSTKTDGTLDGVYGWSTAAAVRLLQLKHGLTVDGIVGIQTWCALGVR